MLYWLFFPLFFSSVFFSINCTFQPSGEWIKDRKGKWIFVAPFLFDDNADYLRQLLREDFKLDPMKLPNITETVQSPFGEVLVEITNGTMYGISNIERSGNVYMRFFRRKIRIEGKFRYDTLIGHFNYSIKRTNYWNFLTRAAEDTGIMRPTISNVTFHFGFEFEKETRKIVNPLLKIDSHGEIIPGLDSDSGNGPVKDLISVIILDAFDKKIIELSTMTALNLTQELFMPLNERINDGINSIWDSILDPKLDSEKLWLDDH